MFEIPVLYRDGHLLVVAKPSGLATTSPAGGDCLVRRIAKLDPDAPRLHPSSRLDAEVTGVVIFARTRKATKALLAARKRAAYERLYLGLCSRLPEPPAGTWRGAIAPDPHDPRRRILVPDTGEGGRPAHTDYEGVGGGSQVALLRLMPRTGRTHQLRVHAAAAGVPLLGDRPYGGAARQVLSDGRVVRAARVMLHCLRVRVPDPEGAGLRTFEAPIPEDIRSLWARLATHTQTIPGVDTSGDREM